MFYAICDSNVQTCLKLNGNAAGLIEIEREGLREREIAFATEMLVLVIYSTYVCEERAILAQSPWYYYLMLDSAWNMSRMHLKWTNIMRNFEFIDLNMKCSVY